MRDVFLYNIWEIPEVGNSLISIQLALCSIPQFLTYEPKMTLFPEFI